MPANNGEERTGKDIVDHAETAYISRVLLSAQLAPCKIRPDVGDMAFHVK
jgi:hypothetical protein